MKKYLTLLALLISSTCFTQSVDPRSSKLKDMAGKQIISSTFDNEGKPYIICFWSRSNNDSHEFLNTMAGQYRAWQKETGVKLITVAEEDVSEPGKILSYIQSKGWTYENYIDEDQAYKKLMNVHDIPHIFVFNGKKEIILQLQSFQPGDELAIIEALRMGIE